MRISYHATTDQPTVVNLTNRVCLNLAGAGRGPVLNHLLTVQADSYLPVNAARIPTGEKAKVAGTPFDFLQPTAMGRHEQPFGQTYVLKKGFFSTGRWRPKSTSRPRAGR